MEANRAVKAFTLHDLGDGRAKGGGAECKKNRAQVLDRLGRLGQGMSAAQRDDFLRFKDARDNTMLTEHGDRWPTVFAGWVQRLLQAHEEGDRIAFSVFMNNETRRCFAEEIALVLP